VERRRGRAGHGREAYCRIDSCKSGEIETIGGTAVVGSDLYRNMPAEPREGRTYWLFSVNILANI
jgi:hypothetical protein